MPVSCHFQGCKVQLCTVKRRYIKYHAFVFFGSILPRTPISMFITPPVLGPVECITGYSRDPAFCSGDPRLSLDRGFRSTSHSVGYAEMGIYRQPESKFQFSIKKKQDTLLLSMSALEPDEGILNIHWDCVTV